MPQGDKIEATLCSVKLKGLILTATEIEVFVSISDHKECDCENLLVDHETWTVILELVLCNNSDTAESLASLLFIIKESIEDGPKGVKRATSTLLDGISLVYLYTNIHKAALNLYLLWLTGHLKPQDEPLQLISTAIERGMAEVERAAAAKRRKKSRTSRRKRT